MVNRKAAFVWYRVGLLLLCFSCTALTVSASIPSRMDEPLILAHRGASGYAPENTMAAFELAEKLGADFIELDVRMSRDGELVVIHDSTVDRTTDFTGNVDQYTLRELQGMDAGSYFSVKYSDQGIVSLQQVMDRFAGTIGILIEIKDPTTYPGIEEKLAEIIRRYEPSEVIGDNRGSDGDIGGDADGDADGVAGGRQSVAGKQSVEGIIVQSFDFISLRHFHTLLPSIPIAVLIKAEQHPLTQSTMDFLVSFATHFSYYHEMLDEGVIKEIHDRNRLVMAWTLRNDRDTERVRRLAVDGIITDYPG